MVHQIASPQGQVLHLDLFILPCVSLPGLFVGNLYPTGNEGTHLFYEDGLPKGPPELVFVNTIGLTEGLH